MQKETENKPKRKYLSILTQQMWNLSCFVIPGMTGVIVVSWNKKYLKKYE